MAIRYPIVPNNITVHLGKPSEAAKNITVSFTDYIKNVASNELYPTWPNESLKANIYAIISFTMNRLYNEWYPSKGYNFDITSSSIYDQNYVENAVTYSNIGDIVDEIFDEYIVKGNQIQPYFTTYCDGRNTKCNGLSQWGTVSLANQGKNYLDILKYYYGNDILIKTANTTEAITGYPGYEIGLGSSGNPVLAIERDLKRIRQNYPLIPNITDTLGIYTEEVANAVRKFQEIFNLPVTGVVDKKTWYKIKYIYTSVKKLSDLYSEGLNLDEVTFLYTDVLKYGDTGIEVEFLNYYLDAMSFLDNDIPVVPLNSVYNDTTVTVVKAFQEKYNLPVTGIFTYSDWQVLKNAYDKILESYPMQYKTYVDELYPNYFLTRGMTGNDVKRYQMFLYEICSYDKSIPGVRVNGEFDELTENSVKKIQTDAGIDVTGIVGPFTWKRTVELAKRQ